MADKRISSVHEQVPTIYFDKSVIEKAFNWQLMQLVEIKYDAQNKRIVITEAEVKP